MRKLLILSVTAALAACDGASGTTAPMSSRLTPNLAAAEAEQPVNQAKPAAVGGGFSKITVVSGNVASTNGGATGAYAYCPTGTTPIGGGHVFTYEGNWSAAPSVTQSVPIVNGWFIRVLYVPPAGVVSGVSFKAYALCAS